MLFFAIRAEVLGLPKQINSVDHRNFIVASQYNNDSFYQKQKRGAFVFVEALANTKISIGAMIKGSNSSRKTIEDHLSSLVADDFVPSVIPARQKQIVGF